MKGLTYQKAISVIMSCNTLTQVDNTFKYLYLFDRQYKDDISYNKLFSLLRKKQNELLAYE